MFHAGVLRRGFALEFWAGLRAGDLRWACAPGFCVRALHWVSNWGFALQIWVDILAR